jgi:serine-type D-Ala-D-Ala carboxypeptidase
MNNQKIKELLKDKINQGIFTGCSLIFGKTNKKILEIYEGTISKTINYPISSKTTYDLQSITKAVATAPLCLKLIQDKHINMDDKIADHFTKFGINNTALSDVTFKNLLTHSSGLSDSDLVGHFKTPNDLWNHMFHSKPQFEPGTSIEYTDLGYRILGKLIENILGTNLEVAAKMLIWDQIKLQTMSYRPIDIFNIAATPDAHGTIDDEQVHFLGDILGCDGVFSNAEDLFNYISNLLVHDKQILNLIGESRISFDQPSNSFFDSLAFGEKCAGWEVNTKPFSYAGQFKSTKTYEKAGGAGTFVWFDIESQFIFVYLTNHGKPKPFDDVTWNRLLHQIGPHEVSNLIYEAL